LRRDLMLDTLGSRLPCGKTIRTRRRARGIAV
jgi:hypothetical protein